MRAHVGGTFRDEWGLRAIGEQRDPAEQIDISVRISESIETENALPWAVVQQSIYLRRAQIGGFRQIAF